jgi:hypothetical protein
MSPALIAAPVPAQWGGKERRPSCWCRALTANLRPGNRLSAVLAEGLSVAYVALRGIALNRCGDNLDFGGRPRGRPLLLISGDVNQGGEMQVLSRELDALNPPELAVDGVGHDRGTGHPKRVPRIVQPLLMESSIPRRAEGA